MGMVSGTFKRSVWIRTSRCSIPLLTSNYSIIQLFISSQACLSTTLLQACAIGIVFLCLTPNLTRLPGQPRVADSSALILLHRKKYYLLFFGDLVPTDVRQASSFFLEGTTVFIV